MSEPVSIEAAPSAQERAPWFTRGVRSIGLASFLADLGHEIPTSLLPSFLTATLGAPAAALGLIEGFADGFAGVARLAGGALSDDPHRRRQVALGGYGATAVLSAAIGLCTTVPQVAVLRATSWLARGIRVPARNALLADVVPASAYGRAYGYERAMDNLGAVFGPVLALLLVSLVSVRVAILLSVIPGLLATLAILTAIRSTPKPKRQRAPADPPARAPGAPGSARAPHVRSRRLRARQRRRHPAHPARDPAPDARPRFELGDQDRPRPLHRLQRGGHAGQHPGRAPLRPLERVAGAPRRRRLLRRRLPGLRLRRSGDRPARARLRRRRCRHRPGRDLAAQRRRGARAARLPRQRLRPARRGAERRPARRQRGRRPAVDGGLAEGRPSCTWRPGAWSRSCCSPGYGPAGRRPTPRRSTRSEARRPGRSRASSSRPARGQLA